MRTVLFFLLFFWISTPWSESVYKSVDAEGNIVYTDNPLHKSTEIQVTNAPKATTSKKPTADSKKTTIKKEQKKPTTYTTFAIDTPKNDESIRSNNGEVAINFAITPQLDTDFGHQITIFLDGKQVHTSQSLQFTLKNIDRGTHSLYAMISDKSGKSLIKAPGLTFHLLRFSHIKR